jgi:hypothetical protein
VSLRPGPCGLSRFLEGPPLQVSGLSGGIRRRQTATSAPGRRPPQLPGPHSPRLATHSGCTPHHSPPVLRHSRHTLNHSPRGSNGPSTAALHSPRRWASQRPCPDALTRGANSSPRRADPPDRGVNDAQRGANASRSGLAGARMWLGEAGMFVNVSRSETNVPPVHEWGAPTHPGMPRCGMGVRRARRNADERDPQARRSDEPPSREGGSSAAEGTALPYLRSRRKWARILAPIRKHPGAPQEEMLIQKTTAWQ